MKFDEIKDSNLDWYILDEESGYKYINIYVYSDKKPPEGKKFTVEVKEENKVRKPYVIFPKSGCGTDHIAGVYADTLAKVFEDFNFSNNKEAI